MSRHLRILALVTDAYGGRGGIAQANRDLLSAFASHPDTREVVVLPRVVTDAVGDVPDRIVQRDGAAGSAIRYVASLLRAITGNRHFDLVFCGHIHLVPAARLAKMLTGAPILLMTHGIEAWKPTGRILADRLLGGVDLVASVSELTRSRFLEWSRLAVPARVVPNCVHLEQWGIGEKSRELLDRLHLHGRKVIMTLGRMDPRERYKGFDEVIEVLPRLAAIEPAVVYLAAGDGPDRPRLERRAMELGVQDRVVFTGYLPADRKGDYYRLADVFAMPSRGEGFGIVILEALACGLPVVGSRADGTREALLDGKLGRLVDPAAPNELIDAILACLEQPRGIPADLDHFAWPRFEARVHEMVEEWKVESRK